MATLQDYLGITKLRDAWPKWKANIVAINNQVINHVAGTADKHAAQDITYSGSFTSKTDVKAALDQAKTEIDLIVVSASIDPEVAFARESLVKSKTFATIDARFEESEQDLVSYKAESATQLSLNTATLVTHTSQIVGLSSGAPLPATLVSQMTDTTRNYVYLGVEGGYTAGNLYYWSGSAWTNGGVYQSTAINDGSIKTPFLSLTLQSELYDEVEGINVPVINGSATETHYTMLSNDPFKASGYLKTISVYMYIAGAVKFKVFSKNVDGTFNVEWEELYTTSAGVNTCICGKDIPDHYVKKDWYLGIYATTGRIAYVTSPLLARAYLLNIEATGTNINMGGVLNQQISMKHVIRKSLADRLSTIDTFMENAINCFERNTVGDITANDYFLAKGYASIQDLEIIGISPNVPIKLWNLSRNWTTWNYRFIFGKKVNGVWSTLIDSDASFMVTEKSDGITYVTYTYGGITVRMRVNYNIIPNGTRFYEGALTDEPVFIVKSSCVRLVEADGSGVAYDQSLNTTDSVKFANVTTDVINTTATLPTGTLASPPSGLLSGDIWADTTDSATHPIVRLKV